MTITVTLFIIITLTKLQLITALHYFRIHRGLFLPWLQPHSKSMPYEIFHGKQQKAGISVWMLIFWITACTSPLTIIEKIRRTCCWHWKFHISSATTTRKSMPEICTLPAMILKSAGGTKSVILLTPFPLICQILPPKWETWTVHSS